MKVRFLLAILLCQLTPPFSASGAVFTFTSPDFPASIRGKPAYSTVTISLSLIRKLKLDRTNVSAGCR